MNHFLSQPTELAAEISKELSAGRSRFHLAVQSTVFQLGMVPWCTLYHPVPIIWFNFSGRLSSSENESDEFHWIRMSIGCECPSCGCDFFTCLVVQSPCFCDSIIYFCCWSPPCLLLDIPILNCEHIICFPSVLLKPHQKHPLGTPQIISSLRCTATEASSSSNRTCASPSSSDKWYNVVPPKLCGLQGHEH